MDRSGTVPGSCVADAADYKEITIPGKPVPYVRQTRKGKYVQPRARAYNDYRDSIALVLKCIWPPLDGYALLTVKVFLKLTKSTGLLPKNAGDWDNFYKTFADACQAGSVVGNDSVIIGPGPDSMNYLSSNQDEWAEIQLVPTSLRRVILRT
ncbi:MAG: RusA family crossover junction endodeoxyribonuclease [Bacillota bacterium]